MKYRKELPEIDYLFECFTPNFDKGILVWNKRPYKHFKSVVNGDPCKSFNTRLSNTIAGCISKYSGYNTVTLDGFNYLQHRILWKMFYKTEPPEIIDHLDENKLNNSIYNLQEATRTTNKVKSSKVYNNSGYRGVYSRKDRKSFEVRVTLYNSDNTKRKDKHVGYYHDIEEAAAAYNLAVKLLGYGDNFLNIVDFPEENIDTDKKFFKEVGYHTY